MNPDPDLAEDVAAASAAYLFNVLPEILKLPASEQFARIASHFADAIAAYRHELADRTVPDASLN